MSINGQDMYDRMRSKFSAQGSVSRFDEDYIFAVNAAVDELCHATDEDVLDHIDDVNDDIELDEDREYILAQGITRYILELGNFKSADLDLTTAIVLWDKAIGRAITRRDKETEDAATDDDTTAMAGEVMGTIGT